MSDTKGKTPAYKNDKELKAAERRRAAARAKKKKRETVKMLLIAGMALIAVLVVVLLALGIRAIVKHAGGGTAGGNPPAVSEEPTPTPVPATEEPLEEVSANGVVTSYEKGFLQVKLNNQSIENLSGLDTTNIGWGYGPSRDEANRPVDAVTNDEKYAQYGAYFVQSGMTDKVIYLTMDEGYEYGYTPTILDTFKELDVQIVFFVTKPFVDEHPDLVQRMIDEGHIVGNHSVNHPADGLPSESIEEQQAELQGVHDLLKEQFNYEMWLFRCPAGKFSEQSLAVINNMGYRSVFWSFAHYDYNVEDQPDEAESLQKCLDSLHPGAIYLLHAVSETNTHILRDFIEGARAQGYRFELIPADGWRVDGTEADTPVETDQA